MEIDVADTSGELIISNVGNARIADTSGSIEIRNVTGNLTVRDTSGSHRHRRRQRNVHIPSDSSGSIRIARVRGSVMIDEDGSGSVESPTSAAISRWREGQRLGRLPRHPRPRLGSDARRSLR